jgi:organic radical activating enzyme
MKPAVKSGELQLIVNLTEIMESIQGEGLLVGTRQVFLRFTGCNLRCIYCDTPASFKPLPYCKVAKLVGKDGGWEQVPNPFSLEQILEQLNKYDSKWVSLTGGEPLLWAEFIKPLGAALKSKGYKLLLETNGTLHEKLEECLPFIDMISMDFKLSSATGINCAKEHARFLLVSDNKPIYIKIVIDSKANTSEIEEAVEIISAYNPNIPVILQPVTPIGDILAPGLEKLLDIQKLCLIKLADVRIIPQMHKIMGLL